MTSERVLTLYTHPHCRDGVFRWMLAELAEPIKEVHVEPGSRNIGAINPATNPAGSLPAISLGGIAVSEPAVMCNWLAQSFPEKGLMAKDTTAFLHWFNFRVGAAAAAVTNTSASQMPTAAEKAQRTLPDANRHAIRSLTRFFARHDYVADNRFTAADIHLGWQIIWGMRHGMMSATQEICAYRNRLLTRPAARGVAQPDQTPLTKGSSSWPTS